MPIQRLTWRTFTSGIWIKGPRENNPEGTLRRAKSVYPLRTGSVRSRSGIHQFSALAAHTVFKAFGTRVAAATTKLYRDVAGTFTEITAGGGGGEQNGSTLRFLTAPPTAGKQDYVFVAGGGALRKINPALNLIQIWGISPPAGTAPTPSPAARSERVIDTFDTVANWTTTDFNSDPATGDAITVNTTKFQATAKKVEGTGSLRVRVPRDRVTRVDRTIAIDLNTFPPLSTVASGDEDYIEMYIAFNKPKHMRSVNISFLVGSTVPATTDDFDDYNDTYSREILIATVQQRRKKKLLGTGDFIRNKDTLDELTIKNVNKVDFSMAEFISEDKIGVTRRVWARITLPKASFVANGNAGTTGKTWANVQGVRISVETNNQGPTRVWMDRIQMIGGVGMQGDYQYMFTLRNSTTGTRSNPFPKIADPELDNALVYNPIVIRNIERTGVDFTTLQIIAPQADPQVDEIEVWRTVGNGTAFFLAERIPVATTTYTDRIADYPGMFSGGGGTKFLQPEELPDDNARPSDAVLDAIGPVFGRMFLTTGTDNRVWYSGIGRCETVSNFVEVGSTDEHVVRLIVWNETLFAFTRAGVYRCLSTDEPFVFSRVLNVPGTRFAGTVKPCNTAIFYQANDGVRLFDGGSSELVADDALAPIFRGGTSDGITSFSGVTSEYGRGEYYISDTNTTLAYGNNSGWRNIGLPCKSIYWETDTRVLLAAVTSGTTRICGLEGDANGEVGGLVAEATVDFGGASLASDFVIETGGDYKGAGLWGMAQRVYIEGQVEDQDLAVELILDNTVISIGTASLDVGIRKVMELPVQRAGWITGVRITIPAASLSKRIEISAVEVDVYVP